MELRKEELWFSREWMKKIKKPNLNKMSSCSILWNHSLLYSLMNSSIIAIALEAINVEQILFSFLEATISCF